MNCLLSWFTDTSHAFEFTIKLKTYNNFQDNTRRRLQSSKGIPMHIILILHKIQCIVQALKLLLETAIEEEKNRLKDSNSQHIKISFDTFIKLHSH